MKFHAYVAVCLCLPFALLAEGETDATNRVPSEAGQSGLDAGFERYKTILDRMPFGRPPPGFDPDAPGGATAGGAAGAAASEEIPASEEEQQILASVRISALNVTPAGKVTVGFTDSSVQPPRNYFMEVGEKRGEWTVVEADPDPEKKTVKLSKGGVEATFKLGEGNDPKGGKPSQAAAANRRPALHRSIDGRNAASTATGPKPSGLEIARARRERMREQHEADEKQKRMAAEQARKDREEAQKAAELAAEERKAQREQLTAIQEMLRQQREEKQAEEERRAAEGQQHE